MRKTAIKLTCESCKRVFEVKKCREKTAKTCSKKCFRVAMMGHSPFHYKGGRLQHKGYIYILRKEHPKADRDGYVSEHRHVMEKHLGRMLSDIEVVHHINGVRDDNRVENLHLAASQSEHMKFHREKGRYFTGTSCSDQ